MNQWGKILVELQREAGISQRRLAAVTGISRNILRGIIAGSSPSISQLERIVAVFGYELDVIKVGPPTIPPAMSAQKRKPILIRLPLRKNGDR